ncbi:MAG: hypothetical protein M0R46_15300 [Candidatus Muirbacterium halophilum]|nr:hypothetical protein [Candidatus Muirbacterium halophilum]MCK9477282.1 hypothetical protein [Candidatus Muirbacterium halophilum]
MEAEKHGKLYMLNSASVKEGTAQTRVVSREFSIEGDNQVPITIVNENDRRIKNIPMINPHNLEGVGMGESLPRRN